MKNRYGIDNVYPILMGYPNLITPSETDETFQNTVKKIAEHYKPNIILKEKQMKTKKFYHTFNVGERQVTLCILTEESIFIDKSINIGYSVKSPKDENIEGLSRKIALGRAEKKAIYGGTINRKYWNDNGVLKGIAFYWERRFKEDLSKYVKGVK